MKQLTCSHCHNRVFFENLSCETCGSTLGYAPDEQLMIAFDVPAPDAWRRLGHAGPEYRPCVNREEGVCNWMLAADSTHDHCLSCRTTHTIPALASPQNRGYWAALEQAKRRLFYTLVELVLPTPNKLEDPANGLSFEFLEQVDPKDRVLTGHDEGVITLNIAEADDVRREQVRMSMHEPYRTLLGHFRHEIGHYYWDRLVRDTPWIDEFRTLFGDERADYEASLKKHYASPVADWPLRFISVYASSHPWEDWAETWAHYLHMVDGLETAAAWGARLDHALPSAPSLTVRKLDLNAESILSTVVEQWLPVSQFINAMDQSLGAHDSYPFIVVPPVIEKLDFIHRVVQAASAGRMPMNFLPRRQGEGPAGADLSGSPPAVPPNGHRATTPAAENPPLHGASAG
ncbi:putative zinc-binding peptidase [Variovorax sp. J22P271]|uniref:zinc-binding metallopeptidase family protein n=1 Tax=Variovorax davisae TaxID=3053515 RepID=UPI0025774C71|nr:putative zinc-binding peptidase [Variovorax sp. J22P271]MDM0035913.1 putative zinc-binding peptidase [Variovorax sp. J22P271]